MIVTAAATTIKTTRSCRMAVPIQASDSIVGLKRIRKLNWTNPGTVRFRSAPPALLHPTVLRCASSLPEGSAPLQEARSAKDAIAARPRRAAIAPNGRAASTQQGQPPQQAAVQPPQPFYDGGRLFLPAPAPPAPRLGPHGFAFAKRSFPSGGRAGTRGRNSPSVKPRASFTPIASASFSRSRTSA